MIAGTTRTGQFWQHHFDMITMSLLPKQSSIKQNIRSRKKEEEHEVKNLKVKALTKDVDETQQNAVLTSFRKTNNSLPLCIAV